MIASGRIHLTALVMLRDHLDAANHIELLDVASRKSKMELQKILAARFPRPDVVAEVRRLPDRGGATRPPVSSLPPSLPLVGPTFTPRPTPTPTPTLRTDAASPRRSDIVEPLSASRYKLQLTVGTDLKDKLERAARLLGHSQPDADLPGILDRALEALIASLEKTRLGKSERPRAPRTSKPGYVSRATRREVVERDGEQCTFVGANGERCSARCRLELDHRHPRALGGAGDSANIRLLCRAHNRFAAEGVFGRAHIAKKIERRRRARRIALGATEMPCEAAHLSSEPAATCGQTDHGARRLACSPLCCGASTSAMTTHEAPVRVDDASTHAR